MQVTELEEKKEESNVEKQVQCTHSQSGYHEPQNSSKNTIVACRCCGKII
jgi:hypothetical protein